MNLTDSITGSQGKSMQIAKTAISGCYQVQPMIHDDERGRFVKTLRESVYAQHGLRCDFSEEYYSTSRRNVLRGMHFQEPPFDHEKLVYCVSGSVLDVIVDLRTGSPSEGHCISVELDDVDCHAMYIPRGCAHGFLTRSESATLVYKTTTEYSPEHDAGVLWSSVQFDWPLDEPVLSERDRNFPALQDYDSPFRYGGR